MFERATRLCRMSPTIATSRPSILPLCSRIVIASSNACVGCSLRHPGIYDRGFADLCELMRHTCARMANDYAVRRHRVEIQSRIEQRFPLAQAGRRYADVHRICRQAFRSEFE
jgi:hypothetical protein